MEGLYERAGRTSCHRQQEHQPDFWEGHREEIALFCSLVVRGGTAQLKDDNYSRLINKTWIRVHVKDDIFTQTGLQIVFKNDYVF